MNVSIVVFSPSGHTLKAAEMIKKAFEEKNSNVRLNDVTGKEEFLYGDCIKENLVKVLGEHDVLFIGGPIYAGHIEKNLVKIIQSLPSAGKEYSSLAVPFVTYGGVHSSVALEEMGRYLRKQKRKSVLGIKIAAAHTLSYTYSNTIYPDKPGPEENEIIRKAVDRVISIVEKGESAAEDQSKSFKYSPAMQRIMYRIFTQDKLHGKFRNVSINQDKCIQCKKCISVCPVDMFHFSDEIVTMKRDKDNCILCAECFHKCPANAIEHPYIEMGKKRLKDGYIHLEEKKSGIYPEV
ncbi:MAG: EFR1 family ferrodoxin [Spirochaetes bacterium]|nr:EFR1 family ferrodoxin [Spirochaetota bacterium]